MNISFDKDNIGTRMVERILQRIIRKKFQVNAILNIRDLKIKVPVCCSTDDEVVIIDLSASVVAPAKEVMTAIAKNTNE